MAPRHDNKIMNQIDAMEETIDRVARCPMESLQVDLSKFSNQLETYCNEAKSTLVANGNAPTNTPYSLRSMTVLLFGIVVAITLTLNVTIVIAGATNSQMVICNIGIAVLYVLVGMCVISDLSRGKLYFQNERELLLEK